jgi:HSP20 family protein
LTAARDVLVPQAATPTLKGGTRKMLWNFATTFLPPADMAVSEGDLLLTFDLPGLTSEDLEIELVDDYLFVRGERKRPQLSEGTVWAHTERGYGRFERRIQLPKGVDADKITASMDNGVLSLIVPKPERLKPRTITIGAGEHIEQRELEPAGA